MITINGLTFTPLTAQPFGYEGEARTGLTARTFRCAGLLTPPQWATLVGIYDTWRASRILDADTLSSGVVGTTVPLTTGSINGLSVTNLACWFAEAPASDPAGTYVSASCTLVDAAEALAVLLRSEEKARQGSEAKTPNLGTVTLGSATITLTKPMETRRDGPSVALSASGTSYITGALVTHKVRQIEGYISSGTFADLLSWYDATIAASPTAGSWFPVSEPTATAEVIIAGGAKSTRYSVSLTTLQII